MDSTYKVRIWKIRSRKGKTGTTYQVRWKVNTRLCTESFSTAGLADSFRSKLVSAARNGEAFDTATGLPISMVREKEAMTWFDFACSYVDMKWPDSAPKYRRSLAESLTRITIPMLVNHTSLPEGAALRKALMAAFKSSTHRADLPADTQQTLKEVQKVSRNVTDLAKPDVLRSVLRALDTNLDGSPAAANTSRIRRVALGNSIDYAVELKLLTENPLQEVKTKKRRYGVKAVDPASVLNPKQARMLIEAVGDVGKAGPPLVAFFGSMYYAALRPEEAANLKRDDLALPAPQWDKQKGGWQYDWGELLLHKARPDVGKGWGDSGEASEERSLKHREDGDGRSVPCPPELAKLLHEHLNTFGTARDGRLFRGARDGGRVSSSTYYTVWSAARRLVFTDEVAQGPLARRPYDLRHAAVSTWLNGGVEAPRVAAWAGHSLAVLLRVYAKCLDGGERAARDRVQQALRSW